MSLAHRKVRFDGFEIDLDAALIRDGAGIVKVEPQVFDLVAFMCLNPGRLIRYDEIVRKIWDGRAVSDSTITSRVNAARRALRDSGSAQRVIQTVRGRGLRFRAEVQAEGPAGDAELNLLTPRQTMISAGAYQERSLAHSRICSIAVLPFENMSNEPETEFLGDGLIEDLMTGLLNAAQFAVISRASSFSLRHEKLDARKLGRLLGAQYLVEGSVRTCGIRARITARLIDAETGVQIWADWYDGHLTDTFELQDHITTRVIAAIKSSISVTRLREVPKRLEVHGIDAPYVTVLPMS